MSPVKFEKLWIYLDEDTESFCAHWAEPWGGHALLVDSFDDAKAICKHWAEWVLFGNV